MPDIEEEVFLLGENLEELDSATYDDDEEEDEYAEFYEDFDDD